MKYLHPQLVDDLKAVAEKHGTTFEELCWTIFTEKEREFVLEDIIYYLEQDYPEVLHTEHNLDLIYARYQKEDSTNFGIETNIYNAIKWVYEELELKEDI